MTESLRVLRILTRFNVGGPARQALALQGEMAALGVKTVLVGGFVQEGEADLAELLGTRGIVRVPALGRRPSPADDLLAMRQIHRLIQAERPHVVHTHMAKAGTVGRVAAVAARTRVRVHTFHGHTLHGYFGAAATRGVVATERALAHVTTALVAVSDRVRTDLLARGVGTPDRFHVVDAGLDLESFLSVDRSDTRLRRSLGISKADHVIAMAGRLAPIKGIDVFLGAVLPILRERPDVHVLIAGDGPEAGRVAQAIRGAPYGGRIHPLGWVRDMASVYSAADVVVLSSRNEGTPLSLIEASAAGVPVVATRVGGVPEVVRDGVTGILVPSGSAPALGAAIGRVLDDPGVAAAMARAGRVAAARFTSRRLAEQLLELYLTLLQQTAPARPIRRAA